MPRITGTVEVRAPIQVVYGFCTNACNLPRLFPKDVHVEVLCCPRSPLAPGSRISLRFERAGIVYPWESVITACEPERFFEDVLVRGPMKRWVSRHTFTATAAGTRVHHAIEYEYHREGLGRLCLFLAVDPLLRRIFHHVHRATKDALEQDLRRANAR